MTDKNIPTAEETTPGNDGEKSFNLMQTVKRRLYAMRNGALAAQMRNGGLNYRINFGVNIPQIKEIASDLLQTGLTTTELVDLANALWSNENTRESRLIAPMILPIEAMTPELATRWLREAQTTEIADHLCHSLLRKLPYADAAANAVLADADASDINRYAALRLILNRLILRKTEPAQAVEQARNEQARKCPLTNTIAAQIINEADFMANGI